MTLLALDLSVYLLCCPSWEDWSLRFGYTLGEKHQEQGVRTEGPLCSQLRGPHLPQGSCVRRSWSSELLGSAQCRSGGLAPTSISLWVRQRSSFHSQRTLISASQILDTSGCVSMSAGWAGPTPTAETTTPAPPRAAGPRWLRALVPRQATRTGNRFSGQTYFPSICFETSKNEAGLRL